MGRKHTDASVGDHTSTGQLRFCRDFSVTTMSPIFNSSRLQGRLEIVDNSLKSCKILNAGPRCYIRGLRAFFTENDDGAGFRSELRKRVTLKSWEWMRYRFQRKEPPAALSTVQVGCS